MSTHRLTAVSAVFSTLAVLAGSTCCAPAARAQSPSIHYQVTSPAQRLEMIVNTSRIMSVEHNIPRLLVQNPEVVQATPLSPNQIQLSALTPGVTAINLWDENNKVHVIDVRVLGDVRELQDSLRALFPDVDVNARPLNASLVLSGYVPRPELISNIVRVAEEYYPNVINHMSVGGAHTVLLHVKVVEVNRNKLRKFGIDWALLTGNDFVINSATGLVAAAATQGTNSLVGAGGDSLRFGILKGAVQFGAFIDVLRQNTLAKVLAEPTLVTSSGRPASFNVGGEIPIPVSSGLGTTSVQFREFGTTVDFVPIVLGNGRIKLEVRPTITEIDPALKDPVTQTPGFRSRRVDTGVEMQAGETLALAGLIQSRKDAENVGIPWVSDLPWVGAAFRRVQETVNEVELLILVTPELVAPRRAHEVPLCGPGESTGSPSDVDLYWRGYLEVPKCAANPGCIECQGGQNSYGPVGPIGPAGSETIFQYEEVQPAAPNTRPQQAPVDQANYSTPPMRSNTDSKHVIPPHVATPAYQPTQHQQRQSAAVQQSAPSVQSSPAVGTGLHNSYEPINSVYEHDDHGAEPSIIGPIGYGVLE